MKPEQIENLSFQIIDQEAGGHSFTADQWAVVRRMIHTSADFEYKEMIRFHPGAITAGIESIRAGKGPSLIELKTARYKGHFEGDPQVYKTPEEIEEEKKKDPITLFAGQLLEQDIANEETLRALSDKAKVELQEAIEFADNSDYPPLEEIYTDLYYEERRNV